MSIKTESPLFSITRTRNASLLEERGRSWSASVSAGPTNLAIPAWGCTVVSLDIHSVYETIDVPRILDSSSITSDHRMGRGCRR